MAEKTEKATPKKLKDAREKGQIAKSQDMPAVATFLVSMSATIAFLPSIYEKISGFFLDVFERVGNEHMLDLIKGGYMVALEIILSVSLPILILVALSGVIATFLIQGPVFTAEVFKPEFKKFDPVQNLKAKFKLKIFVELIKSILKITIGAILIFMVMWDLVPALVASIKHDVFTALDIIKEFLFRVMIRISIFFLGVALLDLVYQKRAFAKEMMMEKFEVKQEHKNTEGDPQIKSKRRETAREIAYSAGPIAGVQHAKVVVTNPTHLAIAVGYDFEEDPAPYIVAMGQNYMAQLIIKEAEVLKIPIMRNIDLAHELYDRGVLFEFIPEHTYEAMAEILKVVQALELEAEGSTE